LREWGSRRWVTAAAVAVVTAIVMGVPTGIIRTSLYHRMTPVLWWNYPEWAASAVLIGLIAATFKARHGQPAAPLAGGLLSAFAVGCPICNKLAVAALGVSGALNIWAPIQPWVGIGSLVLLGYALTRRLRGDRACAVSPRSGSSAPSMPTS
jgi:hypothetical protein